MSPQVRTLLAAVTMVLGIVLIVAGIITHKRGAVVIGMCAAALAAQQVTVARKK